MEQLCWKKPILTSDFIQISVLLPCDSDLLLFMLFPVNNKCYNKWAQSSSDVKILIWFTENYNKKIKHWISSKPPNLTPEPPPDGAAQHPGSSIDPLA